MPAFDKRSPGQKFNPHHEEWNAFIDAARGVKAAQQAVKDGASLYDPKRMTVALARNISAAAVSRGGAVALRAPLITDTDSEPEFLRQLTFDAKVAEAADVSASPQKIGVLLMPLAVGDIGECAVSGIVQCRVDLTDITHRFASLTEGEAYLTSCDAGGPAEILWPTEDDDPDTGEQWALVRLLGGGGADPGGVGSGNDVNFPRSDTNCRWYTAHAKFTEDTTATDLTGYLWFIPFQAPAGGSPAQIGVATTEGAQGAHLRLGIYAAQSSGIGEIAPGALIFDSGDKVAEGIGIITADLAEAEVELTPGGLYWLGVAVDDDAVELGALFAGDIHATLGLDETLLHSTRAGPCRVEMEYGELPEDLSDAGQVFELLYNNWPTPLIAINYGGCDDGEGGLVLDGGDGADSADEAILGSPGNPDGGGICGDPYIAVLGTQNTPVMLTSAPTNFIVYSFTPESTGTYFVRLYFAQEGTIEEDGISDQFELGEANCPGETDLAVTLNISRGDIETDCESLMLTEGTAYHFYVSNIDATFEPGFAGFEIGLGTCP